MTNNDLRSTTQKTKESTKNWVDTVVIYAMGLGY